MALRLLELTLPTADLDRAARLCEGVRIIIGAMVIAPLLGPNIALILYAGAPE